MRKTLGKCHKPNPLTCRLHGKQAREQLRLEQQIRQQFKDNEYKNKAYNDFALSWNVRQEKDGTTTVGVYRSGVAEPPKNRGVEAKSYTDCDQYLPSGRQGRTTSIFASPTLGGVSRWVWGNSGIKQILDYKPREIRVDVDTTWVYSVNAWEKASSQETATGHKAYWDTGMTMREWMRRAKENPTQYKAEDWELLIPSDGVRSVRNVPAQRLTEAAYDETRAEDVLQVLG